MKGSEIKSLAQCQAHSKSQNNTGYYYCYKQYVAVVTVVTKNEFSLTALRVGFQLIFVEEMTETQKPTIRQIF